MSEIAKVYVEVSGLTGSGKSAVLGEIEIAMRALGLTVEHADPAAAQAEKNATHADWQAALNLYKPTVVLAERNVSRRSEPRPVSGEVDCERLLRPIIGIENRTAQEAFDIMCDRLRRALSTRPAAEEWRPTHRHVKRGTDYEVLGRAVVQAASPLEDEEFAVVYRGRNGSLWVRCADEFNDGRFEPIAASPAEGEWTTGARYRCTRPGCGRDEFDARANGCSRGPCPMEFVG